MSDETINTQRVTADGRIFDQINCKNLPDFQRVMDAARLLSEAMSLVGLAKKDAKIVLSDEAFEKIFDDRKLDGHRPEWRAYGIEIEPTNKVVK